MDLPRDRTDARRVGVMEPTLIRRADVRGRLVDVRTGGGRIVEIGTGLPAAGGHEHVVDAAGGALLPGLHDHHLHLLSCAAAARSVRVGPPEVDTGERLAAALRAEDARLPEGAWIRGIGFDDGIAGGLDRHTLDAIVPGRPVRLQHRSGVRWTLNSRAIEVLGLEHLDLDGVQRDATGAATGTLDHLDGWLRRQLLGGPPDLAAVGSALLRYGITGVTDATPTAAAADVEVLAAAVADGSLPVDVRITGSGALPDGAGRALRRGPVKLYLVEDDLPDLDDLVASIAGAHRRGRPVAVHCVSRVELIVAVTALEDAGPVEGDRIEHGAIVPVELLSRLAALGATVVTQPNFVAERGDRYLSEVDDEDTDRLYPCASLLAAGVKVAAGTDAPFGHPDPWRAIAAAVTRTTAGGRVLGRGERVAAETALGLFLAPLEAPGGRPRRVSPGAAADLCLLDVPLLEALRAPSAAHVVGTMSAGVPVAGLAR